MAHFLLYWLPETVRDMSSSHVVSYAGGKQFIERKVALGDVLWGVTSNRRRDLRLIARINVQVVTADRTEAAALTRQDLYR